LAALQAFLENEQAFQRLSEQDSTQGAEKADQANEQDHVRLPFG
jgi:hypothetical protein